jgi:hypothetical protein
MERFFVSLMRVPSLSVNFPSIVSRGGGTVLTLILFILLSAVVEMHHFRL